MKTLSIEPVGKLLSLSTILLPSVVQAQSISSGGGNLGELLVSIMIFINDFLIPFIIGIGFLSFVWGVFLYFIVGGADEEKRAKGRSHVIYAIIGFVVIIIYWGVINLLVNSIGLEGQIIENVPRIQIPGF